MADATQRPSIGLDGLTTLLLSTGILLASGGLSLLYPLYVTLATARRTGTVPPGPGAVAVFGKRLVDGRPDREFRQRLERAAALYRAGLATRLILLGGLTGNNTVSEAAAGAGYLQQAGVPPEQIELEDRSRHTLENLDNMRRLFAPATERSILISNRYHLARCSVLAAGFGLPHSLCAAEVRVRWLAHGPRLLGEAFYLHWYWTGKGWSRLTRNRKSLARIS